jgi:hypothetical protein
MHSSSSVSSFSSSSFSSQKRGERGPDKCHRRCKSCFVFILSLLIFLILLIATWISYFFGGCSICPRRTTYMAEPFRIVPGSGMTCKEVVASQPICRAYRPLMKKFDLESYCGCDQSEPPPNACTFDCPLFEKVTFPPTASSSLTPPTMSPNEVSGSHSSNSHFDEILLLDPTLAPSDRSSSSHYDEPSDRALVSNEYSTGMFDSSTIMCTDISTLLPFISDQGFCKEVQGSCCSKITASTPGAQTEIPLACMMCEPGAQILEEKILAGDASGKDGMDYFLALCPLAAHILYAVG